jgi:hypothetical protein
MKTIRMTLLTMLVVGATIGLARAQGVSQVPAAQDGWNVAVYPVLVWIPLDIGIDVEIPPFENDGGGLGDIADSRFDGAYLGGVAASNGTWQVEGYFVWAGIGGDRLERPSLTVDLDLIYGHATVGRRIAPDLYVTGGVRRVALKYDISLGDLPHLARKPGIWDPLVGIAWHRIGQKVEWHASFDGGGFGVGADVDLGAGVRIDWKPVRHFGFAVGYNLLYLKVTDEDSRRTVIVKPTIHGPAVGIGFYF